MTSSSRPSLLFGIEIEALIRPKLGGPMAPTLAQHGWSASAESLKASDALQTQNRLALRKALAQMLANAAVPCGTIPSAGYSTWTVVDEVSLDEVSGYRAHEPFPCIERSSGIGQSMLMLNMQGALR
jgi:hypothetical protein